MAEEAYTDDRRNKLFVGGLNRDTKDEFLRTYFEKFGTLSDCVVIRDSQTKESRGFGYVTFEDHRCTKEVLEVKRKDGHFIDGKSVDIKRAIPRGDSSSTSHIKTKKVFIGGIPESATDEDIKKSVSEALGDTLVSVDLIKKKEESGGPAAGHRGFCFVEVHNEDDADELCCIKHVEIKGKKVEMKKAEPKGGDGGGGGGGRGGSSSRGRGSGGRYSGGGGGYHGGGGGGYSAPAYGSQYSGGGSYDSYSGGGGGGGYYDNSYSGYTGGGGGSFNSYDSYGGMGMYGQGSYYPPSGGGRGRGASRYQPY